MTLTQLFTAIANAIRAKKGTSGTITASNFPTEIASITTGHLTNEEYQDANDDVDDILENTTVPSGTLNITEDGDYDVTNYLTANVNTSNNYFTSNVTAGSMYDVGVVQSIKKLPSRMTVTGTSGLNMFYNCFNLLEIPELINSSNITDATSMFVNCRSITTMPLIDISNVNTATAMFNYCTNLISIPQFNTQNLVNMTFMFRGCGKLVTLPVLNTNKVTSMQNAFQDCVQLSNESLNNILAMCINATSYTGTKTLAYLGLLSAQATTCQSLSNYQAFLNAGWTTGY